MRVDSQMPAFPVTKQPENARLLRSCCTQRPLPGAGGPLGGGRGEGVQSGAGGEGCGGGGATTSPSIPQAPPLPAEVTITWAGTGRHSVRRVREVQLGVVDQNTGKAPLALTVDDCKTPL